jgi:hypothetical protein
MWPCRCRGRSLEAAVADVAVSLHQADREEHLRGVLAARGALDPVGLLRQRHREALRERGSQVRVVHPVVAAGQVVALDGPQVETLASDHTQLLGGERYPIPPRRASAGKRPRSSFHALAPRNLSPPPA